LLHVRNENGSSLIPSSGFLTRLRLTPVVPEGSDVLTD
jgi:hypothetical protein